MAVYDLYSKRKIAQMREGTEVFFYDEIPSTLRSQIRQIFLEGIQNRHLGRSRHEHFCLDQGYFHAVVKILRREYGVDSLTKHAGDPADEFLQFLRSCNTDHFLDCAELLGRVIANDEELDEEIRVDLINEINHRFMEAALGYEFVDFEIIRVDSRKLHAELLKPTLSILSSKVEFEGANQEIRHAFEKFRNHDNKGAIVEALKAFESTMKAILDKRSWSYKSGDSASKLISACFENGLLPSYMQNHFSALRSMLETGVPVVRNKTSGHGQGSEVRAVDDHLTSYVLYTALANMKLLIDCDMALSTRGPGSME